MLYIPGAISRLSGRLRANTVKASASSADGTGTVPHMIYAEMNNPSPCPDVYDIADEADMRMNREKVTAHARDCPSPLAQGVDPVTGEGQV